MFHPHKIIKIWKKYETKRIFFFYGEILNKEEWKIRTLDLPNSSFVRYLHAEKTDSIKKGKYLMFISPKINGKIEGFEMKRIPKTTPPFF